MASRFTADDLLTSVRSRCYEPSGTSRVSDSDILLMATEELLGVIVPAIKGTRTDFFEAQQDYAIGSTNGFRIPERAIGSTISKAFLRDAQGNVYELPCLPEGLMSGVVNTSVPTYTRTFYYIRGNHIYLNPFPVPAGNTLVLVYYQRPSDLVLSSAASRIVSKTSTTITLSAAVPTVVTGDLVDIVDYQSPFGFKAIDVVATVSGSSLTGLSDTTSFSVGDYVSIAGTSPIPQIPYEFHPLLRYRTTARVLESIGDRQGMQAALASAADIQSQIMKAIDPRNDGQPNVIVSQFPSRNGSYWGRRVF